jgi:hypothetical protein
LVLTSLTVAALASPDTTRDSLDRLEEVLELRIDDGTLASTDVLPAIVVSVAPYYEESQTWYSTRALEVLEKSFGTGGLRLCEACMAPRAFVGDGELVYQTGPVGLDEVVRLDDQARGSAQPAKTAIWLDEHRGGVSIRIVDLRNARLVFAQNVDPYLLENQNTHRMYTLSEELERRARGDSITQAFVDLSLYPGQHVSVDWTDQWGKTNANLSGITFSALDPIAGIGAVHYRRLPPLNLLVGGQVVISVPTALVRIFDGGQVLDPLLTGVALARVPFGRSNFGAVASVSTNGTFGVGVSLLNISFVPVLP